jgi:hypothetical protein
VQISGTGSRCRRLHHRPEILLRRQRTFQLPGHSIQRWLSLNPYNGSGSLTVNGELHKLAHNISFGHGIHAGIHWRSDTDYSILLGEAVAINFLLDQMYSYQENFDITIRKIDGTPQQFKNF